MPESLSSLCLPGPAVLGHRIVVIGSTCAGKTTLAAQLATLLDRPHIELDALHWKPNWTPTPTPELRCQVQQAVAKEDWVCDGNYSKLQDIIWARVDTFVWLDYKLHVVLWRFLKRTLRRVITHERLWNNNVETLRDVFSRDSLLLWLLKRYHSRRRKYNLVLKGPEYQHKTRIVLPNPRETARFLQIVEQQCDSENPI